MKRHLFLQGEPGLGKSSLLRKALLPHLKDVGGFFVSRVIIGGKTRGFSLNPVGDPEGYCLNKRVTGLAAVANLFLHSDEAGTWHSRLDVFSGAAAASLTHTRGKKLLLLDEIGGVDLGCPEFVALVREVLKGPLPVLGVIKSPGNYRLLADRLNKGWGNIREDVLPFTFFSLPSVAVVEVNRGNLERVEEIVNNFTGRVFKHEAV